MILAGQGNGKGEIEFYTKAECWVWGFFYTRLVWIRNVLSITEHHSSNNLFSFSANPQTKWLRSKFKFSMMIACQGLRGREMKTPNCCWCSSEIQPLWNPMLKQNSTSHLFPAKWELPTGAFLLLRCCPAQPRREGRLRAPSSQYSGFLLIEGNMQRFKGRWVFKYRA